VLGFWQRRAVLRSWADVRAGLGDAREWAREIRLAGLGQSGCVRRGKRLAGN
jgi:hypothetical protein